MSGASEERLAQAVGRAMYDADNASRALGMVLDEIRPGLARMRMTVRGDMINGHDLCHGGLIFTLADSAFAFACNSYNRATVAAGAEIRFRRPTRLGDRLVATATERERHDRDGLYDVLVTVGDEVVAVFTGRSKEIGGPLFDDPQPS
jgi:acyl-CoA thioesterase